MVVEMVEMVEVKVEMVEDKEVEVEEVPEITSSRRSRTVAGTGSRRMISWHIVFVMCANRICEVW